MQRVTDGEGTLLWWGPGYRQWAGVGQNAGLRSDFCKNYSPVQTLLSLRPRETSGAGGICVLQALMPEVVR